MSSTPRPRPKKSGSASKAKPDLLLANTKALISGLTGIGGQAYFVWDYVKQRMLAGGDRLAELYGYDEDEIDAMPAGWLSLVHPDDVPVSVRMTKRLLRAGQSTVVTEQLRIRCKDGHYEFIHVSQRVLERNAEGKMVSSVGLSQVITRYVVPYEEVAKREALYRQMVDEAGDAIFLFDERGAIHYANRFISKLLGYKDAELRGQSVWHVFELPRKGWLQKDLAKMGRNVSPRISCNAKCLDGNLLAIDLRVRRLGPDRFLGIARDVSQEMLLAEATQQQAAYYRGLIRNNNSGVAVFDEKLRIVATNRALASLLKYSEKRLAGCSMAEFLAKESKEEGRTILAKMKQDHRFNSHHRQGFKLVLQDSNGKPVQVHATFTAIGDSADVFRQGIAIFTDITEEQRYRSERDEHAKFNEVLLSNLPVAIVVSDPSGRIVDVNPALEQLTGFSRNQLIGKFGWESGLLDEEEAKGTKSRFKMLVSGTEKIQSTLRLQTKRGGLRIVDTQSTAAFRPNGEMACIIITGVDVTERKRLEAEVIKVAEQEQMRIGNDLHDGVGQVLTGIMSLTEALEAGLSGPPAKEATRIRELVREAIVQVRQLSHGLSPAAVKHRGLGASLRLLADRIRSSKLSCECRIDWEPSFNNVEAETHLFRIAQEAVSNAIRHGRPTRISILLRHESGNTGLMEIQDDGIGIKSQQSGRSEGVGIRVMRYRTSLIGGEFQISRRPTGGTRVLCRFTCTV